ncbi:hypothetical protein EW145_g2563 [Phellinidium pouzarii]|uniref:Uncharacterized protein n=1 Tax=Phellinidium pouzarii TaxID=167371 RepID=A0A4V6S190_9AGAM|nr:hypothetical protein EW145_g2563 [Phellinidium pouzarii]
MSNSPGPAAARFTSAFDASRSEALRLTATGRPASAFGSPTSTLASVPTRMPLRNNPAATAFGTPTKRVIIRADPTLVTCFDPADKELYDLWAPK